MSDLTFTSGMKLLREKKYQAVYDQSLEALRLDERNPLPFFLLGVLASETGSHDKALEFFAKAVEHEAGNVHYQIYYAKALVALGQNEKGKIHADKAAALGTRGALLSDMIGVVYSRTGYHELAIPFFKHAVKKNPKWAKFHFNLGASAEFIGDFNTAKASYVDALSIDPTFYLAWFSLAHLEKQSAGNNKLKQIMDLFENAAGSVDGQLLLGHAAAKTLEDMERYEESYDWLKKGKKIKRAQTQYDQAKMAALFKAVKTPSNIAQTSKITSGSTKNTVPIFVVGLPRTGTTLVDRILSSHARVKSAGELNVFSTLVKVATGMPVNADLDVNDFIRATTIDMARLGEGYVARTQDMAKGASHLVDKMPFNFLYVSLINRALPNAKIIALRRGAMDSCLSNYRQLFAAHTNNHDYSFDLEDTAAFYKEFDGLMSYWRETLPPDRFMEVAYENIVYDQENQTRQLLDFCGLDWDEACMKFHENNAPVSTASAVQVRKPLYSGSIDRWKKYGAKLDDLKTALGDLAN